MQSESGLPAAVLPRPSTDAPQSPAPPGPLGFALPTLPRAQTKLGSGQFASVGSGPGLSRERSKGVHALYWPSPPFPSPQFIPLSWGSEGTASPCLEGPRRHTTSPLTHAY